MLKPSFVSQGIKYQQQGKYAKAKSCYEKALKQRSDNVAAMVNLGVTLHHLGQAKTGIKYIDKAIRLQPNNANFLYNKAELLRMNGWFHDAIPCYKQVMQLEQPTANCLYNLGRCYEGAGLYQEAIALYEQAFEKQKKPNYITKAGQLLNELGFEEHAKACYENALKYDPANTQASYHLANLLFSAQPFEAKALYEKVYQHDQQQLNALIKSYLIDWHILNFENYEEKVKVITSYAKQDTVNGKEMAIAPFATLMLPLSQGLMTKTARWHSGVIEALANQRVTQLNRKTISTQHKRLRIAYLSSDIHDHPVAHLTKNLYATHDKDYFEIYLYSTGPNADNEFRTHIKQTCEHFIDCAQQSDIDIAQRMIDDEIDILVDLGGHCLRSRLDVVALRPAPINVSYLGYSNTTGADFIDYVIADDTVIPEDAYDYYSEKPAILPEVFMVTDDKQVIANTGVTRSDQGLPEDKFILCAFSNSYKIEPTVFSAWMSILDQCPDAVLWLSLGNAKLRERIYCNAERYGINRERILFSERTESKADHLARLQLADLYLETFYYGAHTTCVDMLWAGVPVLSCQGNSFQQRVSSSLLKSVGLEELIVHSSTEYVEKAITLINNKNQLCNFKEKLKQTRQSSPLFDTKKLVRQLESAYNQMWERYLRGEKPDIIRITDTNNGQ